MNSRLAPRLVVLGAMLGLAGAASAQTPPLSADDIAQIKDLSAHYAVSPGTADYQDEYKKTPAGWCFASRTVLINSEKDAGLDAADMLAINQLGGTTRLLTVGTHITVVDGEFTGRVFLPDGSYRDEVYEETTPGQWRKK